MLTMSQKARAQRIREAIQSRPSDGETLPVGWRDDRHNLKVVMVQLDAVVLNPHSHRIRSQLESHPKAKVVSREPFSEDAQEIIADIIRKTEDYDLLLKNIDEEGQRDAGIATHNGVLINANTRAVALRDLRSDYIRIAVLPEDATQKEIDDLELRLQMQKSFKQPYTFTNELLFVDDLIQTHGRTAEEIARALGWAASSVPKELNKGRARVDQSIHLLNIIRQVQAMSAGGIPLTFFDEKRQVLIEIDSNYQDLVDTDSAGAQRLRDARLIGLLLGMGYRELRYIDEHFFDEYLVPHLEQSDALGDHAGALASPTNVAADVPGLDVIEDEDELGDSDPRPLLDLLTGTARDDVVELPGSDGSGLTVMPRETFLESLRDTMDSATGEAEADRRNEDRLSAPIDLLRDAERRLKRALDGYKKVSRDPNFEKGKFRYSVKRLRRAVETLEKLD